MYPQEEIDGFERYWRRRRPGRSTAIHYRSDVNIFFRWVKQLPATITIHHIDQFIDWQRELGRASATIQRRLVAIRMFFDYLAYIREEDMSNPVLPRRHYITPGRHVPRNLPDDVIAKLFAAPAPTLALPRCRDRPSGLLSGKRYGTTVPRSRQRALRFVGLRAGTPA
jgi:site-specific recombinase XerD